jgi:DMSO/TMAO reductase YedYZ molybdopterin-dependent catalytic subunit
MKLGGAGIVGVAFAPLIAGCEKYAVEALGDTATTPFLTPTDRFFVQNGGQGSIDGWTPPALTRESWAMTIEGFQSGDVATPLTVRWADLMAARDAGSEVTILKTIGCVLESPLRLTPTGYMGNAYWTGVPLKIFLDRAGLHPSIARLLISGADEFANNIVMERITKSDEQGLVQPLLVYQMNGQPLTPEHGFPVRLIMEEGFGYKNVKWISRIVATRNDFESGTYQDQGFVDDGIMRVTSRSTNVREGTSLTAGAVEISGFAVSGFAPVSGVEVSIDNGAFAAAEIVPLDEIRRSESLPPSIEQIRDATPFPYRGVWAQWRFRWNAPAGKHRIAIRASDAAGNAQPEIDRDLYDGQTGITIYEVDVA